jgi:hypothetical protein
VVGAVQQKRNAPQKPYIFCLTEALERLVQPHEVTNKKDEADKLRKQLAERNPVQKKPKL